MANTEWMGRRAFLTALAAFTAGFSAHARAAGKQSADAVRINSDRLQRTLEELSTFGRPAGGSFADGVSRVAYSEADVAGRRYVMGRMRSAGIEPRIDTAGNIHGLRAGSRPGLQPIVFGSHIDSVPSGGNFDGELGSLAAIEVLQTLEDAGIRTRHPLEISTPMPERHNALLAAAKLIEAVQDEVTKIPGRQVGTVGQLTVFPNAPNVVPGLVKHTIEFRDLSEETLVRLGAGRSRNSKADRSCCRRTRVEDDAPAEWRRP